MSESVRVVVERWLGALASGELASAMQAAAPEVALHGVGATVRGRSSVSFVLNTLKTAFPDLHLQTEILACEGPWAFARFTARGTQQVALFGLTSGEVREVAGLAGFSVSDEGITDVWLYVDAGQMVTQLDMRSVRATSDTTARGDQPASWRDRFTSGAREVWLAGATALGAAGEQGERLFHALLEHGRALESSGRERVSGTAETLEQGTRALAERARQVASSGEEYVRDMASGVRGLTPPTRAEFEELNRKVDRLLAGLEPTTSKSPGDTDHGTGESTPS